MLAGPGAAQGLQIVGDIAHGGAAARRPVARRWAVLHRVTMDGGAAIDSVRTDGGGRYRFRVAGADTAAVYLVSTEWMGIGYFSHPARMAGPRVDTLETIVVYDTSSVGPPLRLVRRLVTFVRSDEADHGIDVLDAYYIENPGGTARISGDTVRPAWSIALPAGAVQFQSQESDVSPEGVVRRGDSTAVYATIAPGGIRQITVTYALPRDARRVTIPIDQWTGELDLLVEGRESAVAGAVLSPVRVEDIEGRTFRRFRGGPLDQGVAIAVTMAGPGRRAQAVLPFVVAVLVLVFGAGVYVALRPRRRVAAA